MADLKPVAFTQWTVVLHNDDLNAFSYFVTCLINVLPGVTEKRANEIAAEIEGQGRSSVITCPLELAELYQQRFEELVLTATIERA
jgi:ATP-dependent Clp protease adaptor protein ClpS